MLPEKEVKQPGTAGCVCVCVELLKRSKTCTSLTTAAYIFMTLYLEYW